MGKALNIKNEATVELAMEVARLGKTSLTEAVNLALTARLEALRAESAAHWDAWIAEMKANPLAPDEWVEPDDPPADIRAW